MRTLDELSNTAQELSVKDLETLKVRIDAALQVKYTQQRGEAQRKNVHVLYIRRGDRLDVAPEAFCAVSLPAYSDGMRLVADQEGLTDTFFIRPWDDPNEMAEENFSFLHEVLRLVGG